MIATHILHYAKAVTKVGAPLASGGSTLQTGERVSSADLVMETAPSYGGPRDGKAAGPGVVHTALVCDPMARGPAILEIYPVEKCHAELECTKAGISPWTPGLWSRPRHPQQGIICHLETVSGMLRGSGGNRALISGCPVAMSPMGTVRSTKSYGPQTLSSPHIWGQTCQGRGRDPTPSPTMALVSLPGHPTGAGPWWPAKEQD